MKGIKDEEKKDVEAELDATEPNNLEETSNDCQQKTVRDVYTKLLVKINFDFVF